MTGIEKTKARSMYPDLVDLIKDYHYTIDGAEKYDDFLSRVKIAFEKIIDSPLDSLAIVTHGGTIKCIMRDVLKLGELHDLADCARSYLEKRINILRLCRWTAHTLHER